MSINPEVQSLGIQLAAIASKKSVEVIFDKIRAVKQKGNTDEIIRNLEEIINELIADKNQLIQISQAYEEQIITQKMTDNEIEYITNSVVPLLENLLEQTGGEQAESIQNGLDIMKPILSKETFNIMQILGFNFKKAIGEPLTKLVESFISSKIQDSSNKAMDLQILQIQREVEYIKLSQNEEAYKRLMDMYGK